MANRNPRPVQFQDRNLGEAVRVNTQLPQVARDNGQELEGVSRAADVLSGRIGRLADDAMAVEAQRQGKLDAAADVFRPRGGTTIRDQNYDKAGGDAYFSKLSAEFEGKAQTLFEQHKNDPAGWQQAYGKLRQETRERDVFPEFQAAFDARAERLNTSYRATALQGFEQKQKDQRLASFVSDMRTSETARTRMLTLDPNAPDIDANVNEMVASQLLRIDALRDAGDISAVKAEELKASTQSEARVQVLSARAAKLQTDEDVMRFRGELQGKFAKGELKGIDGAAWQQLDAGLQKLAKAKKVETDRAEGELSRQITDFLDRQSRGLQPSVTELTALSVQAEKLGPRGVQLVEEARQKLQLRQLIETMPIERAERMVAGLKQEVARGGKVNEREASAVAFLRQRGWSQAAAVAMAGNLVGESALNTQARNPGDGRDGSDSIGISQWNGPRADALKAYAKERGKDWTDLQTQLEFMDRELRTTEKATGDALMRAGSVEDATRAAIGFFRPAGWTADNPEGGHNFQGRLANARRLAGGVAAAPAAVIEDAQKALEARRKRLDEDQLGEAERSGTVATIAPMEWQARNLKDQIGARIVQADAVARANGRAAQYLRPAEKDRLREVIQAGGDKALGLVEQIVEGAGQRASEILKEIEPAAPRLAMLGVMLSRGSAYQRDAARDAFEALRLEQQPGAKITAAPKTAGQIEREEYGSAFGTAIADKQKAIDAARLVYRGKMARFGYDPDSAQAESLYRESLQIAMGRNGKESATATGGIADYKPAGDWFGSAKVAVPDRVIGRYLPDVFGAITEMDLKEHPGGAPKAANGQPYDASVFRRAYPVQVPGGYAFQMNPPGSENPIFVRGDNGRPFVLDWNWYSQRARPRVPQAFR
jgi:hypothetical protein